jgi:SAM-dependent methyltransferase
MIVMFGLKKSHQATLDRLMRGGSAGLPLAKLFGHVSDDFWLWCFTEGYRRDERLRAVLPAFPPVEVQCRFTGAAGDDTMREAFQFYSLVKSLLAQHERRTLNAILEFGCGWGRIIRLFTRDVDPPGLWGIDCMSSAIDTCRETNPLARFELTDPFPPTILPANTFDLVYAYSVFSHLSEEAHLAWLGELNRVLKPEGLLIVTTRPREFIFTCAATRETSKLPSWAAGTAMSFKETEAALARYDRGEFLFEPTGGGDVLDASFFGETCIPQQYVVDHWSRIFEFVGYLDDRRLCLQNVIVVRKGRHSNAE